jgi:hypothetical protein
VTRNEMRDRIAAKVHLLECGCSQMGTECQPTGRITDAVLDDLWPEVERYSQENHRLAAEVEHQEREFRQLAELYVSAIVRSERIKTYELD